MLGLLLISAQLLAQNRTITGRVTDEKGNGVANSSVLVKGTKIGASTDANGNFSLSVPSNARVLVFSSVGFDTKEVTIGNSNTVDANLISNESTLSAVVVVGYTSTTKEAFTGSAKQVAGERLTNKEVSNVSQALAGEVSGVRVINTSGQPGTSATIRIRGIGSVNGNRAPLYVVDGVPFSGAINAINPEDIASITVLKDAAATAIYGSRGANGVIVVSTKTGKGKKSFIEVDGKYGVNKSLLPRYDVIRSPEQFIALGWEALYNQGVRAGSSDPVNYANIRLFSGSGISPNNNMWNLSGASSTWGAQLIDPTTRTVKSGINRKFDPENWEDFAFQASNRQEVNLKIGGSDGRTNYYTSFGYLKDEGYSIKSDFRRLSARLNLTHEVKSWLNASMNVAYANAETNNNGQESNSNSVFWFVDNIPSIYPLFLRDKNGNKVADPIFGGYQYDYGTTGRKFGSLTNAIADANYNINRDKRNELTGNTSVNLNFTKHLSLENRLGVQYYNNVSYGLTNKFYGSAASQNGSIQQDRTELLNLNLLNMLHYRKNFGNSNLEALVAHEATDYKISYSGGYGYNLIETNSLELSNAVVITPSAYSNSDINKLESYFAQINYDYSHTYYVSATGRRDGSSRFIGDNKWGTFGSLGLGWEMTRMGFMKNLNAINYLKLKASYGVLGDQQGLGFYPGYSQITAGNLNDQPSFLPPVPGNPDLTWETSKMFQAGVDFKLGDYLTGTVEYYLKNTDNLIFQRRVGISNGFALLNVNDGQLRNKGVEFDLTGHILKGKDFFLDLGINGEHFRNKITAMPIDPSTGKQKVIDPQGSFGYSVGHSIYDFYIRNFAGVDPNDGTSTWTVYYNDLNTNGSYDAGEGVANLEDYYANNPDKKGKLLTGTTKTYSQATLYYIGKSAIPDLRGGINLNGGWKGFELGIQVLYSFGGYAYDGAYATLMGNGLIGGNNWSTDITRRWQKKGDVTEVPRLSNNADANVNSVSSRFVTKANYLVLNNVRLAYTIPSSVLSKTNILQQATIFVSGDNLWLHSARNGFNPSTAESGASDMYRYSPLSTITAGLRVRF